MTTLLERIRTREAAVVVVGAGYVGLPLAVEVARAGFKVTAYDKAIDKVQSLGRGVSYINDVPSETLAPLVEAGALRASADPEVLGTADVVIICVPTPLNKTKDPDNSFILDAAEMLASRMKRPQLVVLESTTFPGFTREVLLPRFVQAGRKPDEDFFLAFSPERVDPGNPKFFTHNTPKVLGGISPKSLAVAQAMYGHFIETIVPVSSTDSAEMVKLLENTFRAVNIGLVNEVAIMCGRLGLDTWEVIQAAASKPFGFMPFYPGPGLGGHCIPIDPLYLSWKLKTLKYNARFITLADEINSAMPAVVAVMVSDALNARRKAVRGSRLLICGVAYKRDIDDVRESPALDIIELLQRRGAEVAYSDLYAPSIRVGELQLQHTPIEEAGRFDCVVITTDHRNVDYAALVERAQLVVDTRNATRALRAQYPDKIVSL
ncbi:MAG TPA: nucleotide sugar dehydrogenase [Polyangia bacterium]|nr:nucleotide sugar dehydrogenase [Polyangia bacterium]